ncbi:MAG: hypothetical protein V4555_17055 [Acidobacteriota bacterium]
MRRTLVCLANSYKHGGRCVAGVCLETGKWIRLRSGGGDGSLAAREYTLGDGMGELRLQDVFEVDLHYAMPSDCHPEDWVSVAGSWHLVGRPCSQARWETVKAAAERKGCLLGGYGDRMRAAAVEEQPLSASLALVCPSDVWWWVREERGKLRYRALFKRDQSTFDLAVTDPRWLEQMQLLPVGLHPHKLLAPDAKETWLTVSLSEAFAPKEGGPSAHFRIVAGVMLR